MIRDNEIRGRTVLSYRIAAEMERRKWKFLRQELDRNERKVIDEMMSYPRFNNTAGVGPLPIDENLNPLVTLNHRCFYAMLGYISHHDARKRVYRKI